MIWPIFSEKYTNVDSVASYNDAKHYCESFEKNKLAAFDGSENEIDQRRVYMLKNLKPLNNNQIKLV